MDTDRRDAWDAYWTEMLEDDFWRDLMLVGLRSGAFFENLDFFRSRNVRRVLLPGNGCSLLPHALVHVGFDVTVVDISPVACQTMGKYEQEMKNPQQLRRFLSLRRAAKEKSSDGRLTTETADLLDWEPREPFDLIYDDRCVQVLGSNDWQEIARRYFRWLQPAGFCILETANLGGPMGQNPDAHAVHDSFKAAFQDAGFSQFYVYRSCPEPPSERFVSIIHGSG